MSHDVGLEELTQRQFELQERLLSQGRCLALLTNNLEVLAKDVATLVAQAQAPHTPPPAVPTIPQPIPNVPPAATREPKLQLPNRYEGQPGKCKNFLAQCEIFFRAQPSRFQNEDSRICFILSLLAGAALDWVGPLIRANSAVVNSLGSLMNELISVFDHNVSGQDAATRLMNLSQGRRSVAEFSITFRSLASSTGWADEPLMTIFIRSLSEPVRDALATVEPSKSLDALVQTAIRIDNRVREREKEKQMVKGKVNYFDTHFAKPLTAPVTSTESNNCGEPMQVDGAMVRNVRNFKGRRIICYHCNKPGHIKPRCPDLKGNE